MRKAGDAARLLRFRGEIVHARHRALEVHASVGKDGDAARVVAAVLEAAQALDQDRNDVAACRRADDAAHG
jgi:hypothetical protein